MTPLFLLTLLTGVAAPSVHPDPILAYIDPGSGHMLIQLVLAVAAGSLFYAKTIIGYVKRLFGRGGRKTETTAEATSEASKTEERRDAAGGR